MKSPQSSIVYLLTSTLFGVILSTFAFSQTQIWGVSKSGGENGIGTVFNILDDGTNYNLSTPFLASPEGTNPRSGLYKTSEGLLIGSTSSGGVFDAGTIYTFEDGEYTKLFDLEPGIHGSNIRTDIIELNDGSFVAATFSGGQFNGGSLLRFELDGSLEVLFSFINATTGSGCNGKLAYDTNQGLIYGTCSNGGSEGSGTAFRYVPNSGIFSVIHNFTGTEGGANPRGGLVLSGDNILYGTAEFGGEFNQGLIYQINPFGNIFSKVYDLNSASFDGRFPNGNLILVNENTLYGTCSEGGTFGAGSVFSCTTEGEYTLLHSFSTPLHGSFPKSGLVDGEDDFFYGVTELGAAEGFGSVYRVDSEGNFDLIKAMSYTSDGANSVSNLTLLDDGSFVGTCRTGGTSDFGTIFNINVEGFLDKLHDFSLPLEGSMPNGQIQTNNEFFGVTETGGITNDGIFYNLQLDGTKIKLHDFVRATDGQNPNEDIVEGSDGLFFGTTRFGGENEAGTFYSMTSNGDITVIHHFAGGVEGEFPFSGVVAHANGNFYGTTASGGNNQDGIFYKIDAEGNFEKLHDFLGFIDGSGPQGRLVEGNDGFIYGVTNQGGNFSGGTLFRFDPSTEAVTVVRQFQTFIDGGNPVGGLMAHSDGSIYGTTTEDGFQEGTLFKFNPANSIFQVLHSFDPFLDGFFPLGGLAEDENGVVYGFNSEGGAFNAGTAFKYSDATGFEKIYDFSFADSPRPVGTPALFVPECFDDDDCVASDPCSVAFCDFGLCQEVPINPVFQVLNIGACQTGLNTYEITLSISIDQNPGGILNIAGSELELNESTNSYFLVVQDLPTDGLPIELNYEFLSTGCSGSTGVLGTAPEPCPPVQTTFIVDVSNIDVDIAGMHLAGNFQGWNPSNNPMIDLGNDLWELTLDVGVGDYEFNFFNGSNLFDGEYVIGECANNGKRLLTIEEETPQTIEFCWGTCFQNCDFLNTSQDDAVDFKIYPNPINGGQELRVDIPRADQVWNYFIVDISGRQIKSGNLSGSQGVLTNGLIPGMYHIYFQSQNAYTRAQKFIVQ
jgi:uncharacterized repeat protein (TIGR03803 family)